MDKRKLLIGIFVTLCLLLTASAALGEQVRVLTPGGALNMRKTAEDKGKVVTSVPNRSLVELVEQGEEWSKITYKKSTGYVKNSFLLLPEQMVGQTVYPDEGTVLIREYAAEEAPILLPIHSSQSVKVLSVQEGWAKVQCGDIEGFAQTQLFSFHYEEPQGTPSWISEPAQAVKACDVRLSADPTSRVVGSLQPDDRVTVTWMEGDLCLVIADDFCGYADCQSLFLTGPQETEERLDSLSPSEAAAKAEAALKKKYKPFASERFYCVPAAYEEKDGVSGPLYHCAFLNDQDQYMYGALVNADSGDVIYMAQYTAFSAPPSQNAFLPKGEASLTISGSELAIGDVLDITVQCWENCQIRYSLAQNGQLIIDTEPGQHFTAAYRPRESGSYRLTVTFSDASGASAVREAEFTVNSALPVSASLSQVYSQRDGWWKEKQYRHSNLDKSGCAIFALSHILQRMGYTDDSVLPENLAVTYANCLIKGEGTSNELLINTAAKRYNFTTRGRLYDDKKQIVDLIRQGAYFSFSIARGHIAMVSGISEDGTMVRVVDSAPQATFERIVNAAQYYEVRSGVFRAALSLDDLPGARWYFETDEYGGLEYYLPIDYVAKRGVRLVLPKTDE